MSHLPLNGWGFDSRASRFIGVCGLCFTILPWRSRLDRIANNREEVFDAPRETTLSRKKL